MISSKFLNPSTYFTFDWIANITTFTSLYDFYYHCL